MTVKKPTGRRRPEPPEQIAKRLQKYRESQAASGGRQVAAQLDATAAEALARIEALTGMTPRAFFNRILRHPDIDRLAEEVRDLDAPGVVKSR
jgi:hypothetical protein